MTGQGQESTQRRSLGTGGEVPLRIGYVDNSNHPVTLSISVEAGSASWPQGRAAVLNCRRILEGHGPNHIHVEIKESDLVQCVSPASNRATIESSPFPTVTRTGTTGPQSASTDNICDQEEYVPEKDADINDKEEEYVDSHEIVDDDTDDDIYDNDTGDLYAEIPGDYISDSDDDGNCDSADLEDIQQTPTKLQQKVRLRLAVMLRAMSLGLIAIPVTWWKAIFAVI